MDSQPKLEDVKLDFEKQPSQPMKKVETTWRIRIRYILWKICTFFITLVVLLFAFTGDPGKVWTVALVNLAITTVFYFVYRFGWTRVTWGIEMMVLK